MVPPSYADCAHGHPRQAQRASLALAEWLCRTADRIDPPRVPGSCRRGKAHLRRILRSYAHYYNDIRTHPSLDKMRRFLARFTGLVSSVHTRYLPDFIITTSGFRFSVHTGDVLRQIVNPRSAAASASSRSAVVAVGTVPRTLSSVGLMTGGLAARALPAAIDIELYFGVICRDDLYRWLGGTYRLFRQLNLA
jgi:hypothetical protein